MIKHEEKFRLAFDLERFILSNTEIENKLPKRPSTNINGYRYLIRLYFIKLSDKFSKIGFSFINSHKVEMFFAIVPFN